MSTALVLARPERRRILRELLSRPELLGDDRQLYAQMCFLEYADNSRLDYCDFLADHTAKRTFSELIFTGVPAERAREVAIADGHEAAREYKQEHSPGRRERERRRSFREAVAAFQGGIAVTAGLVETCIVCGGAFYPKRMRRCGQPRRVRRDAAYCSDACRQTAYRQRKRLGPTITQDDQKRIRERREVAAVLVRFGVSRKEAARWRGLADIPEGETDDLIRKLPDNLARDVLASYRKSNMARA